MKQTACLILVLLTFGSGVSRGFDGPAFMVDGQSSTEVFAGQTIKVDLITPPVTSMSIQQIIDTVSVMGIASNPILSEGWTWDVFDSVGTVINSGSVLIENATGTVGFGDPPVEGIAYSFDYTVPDVPVGEVWTIGPGHGCNKKGTCGPAPLTLTLVPAPCSCLGDLNGDEMVDLEDLQATADILLDAGVPFIVPAGPDHCGELNGDGQIDLEDLQESAGWLLDCPGYWCLCGGAPSWGPF